MDRRWEALYAWNEYFIIRRAPGRVSKIKRVGRQEETVPCGMRLLRLSMGSRSRAEERQLPVATSGGPLSARKAPAPAQGHGPSSVRGEAPTLRATDAFAVDKRSPSISMNFNRVMMAS
jgi:hypothetical protein